MAWTGCPFITARITRPSIHRHARRAHSSDALQRHVNATIQRYISVSDDPFLNLSIEHYLLQKSPPDSTILMLYVNRPSVIIGRNQNPWSEVNLPLLRSNSNGIGMIDLVRRRSGGGTVFHDHGNVNWTVICPPATFTRDKHAEMVVRALRQNGIDRARVNERHDIVIDQGEPNGPSRDDLHTTPYRDDGTTRSLKASGSAYKLTKYRALHHGTCLLNSPSIGQLGKFLRSPLKHNIAARGVESVSSPVTNIGMPNDAFMAAVQEAFQEQYACHNEPVSLDDTCRDMTEIDAGMRELQSEEWTYLQTPQFTLTAESLDFESRAELIIRYGIVTDAKIQLDKSQPWQEISTWKGLTFHKMQDWPDLLRRATKDLSVPDRPLDSLASWLGERLPPMG